MQVTSVFVVTELKTDQSFMEFIDGHGQDAISGLRKEYPRLSRFILEGFEIDGVFVPLDLDRK